MTREDSVDRRRFVLQGLPACAAACVFLKTSCVSAVAQPAAGQSQAPPKAHKFDSELPRRITYREAFAMTYGRAFIPLALMITRRLGRDAGLDLLKASATEQAASQALEAAKAVGGTDFAAFKKAMNNPAVANVWTRDVVEDSDSAFEVRVSECLWAATFRDAKAGDEGFAAVCHGDYAFATAFNPRLELVRDRTLMQGHAFCNHRYRWKK